MGRKGPKQDWNPENQSSESVSLTPGKYRLPRREAGCATFKDVHEACVTQSKPKDAGVKTQKLISRRT